MANRGFKGACGLSSQSWTPSCLRKILASFITLICWAKRDTRLRCAYGHRSATGVASRWPAHMGECRAHIQTGTGSNPSGPQRAGTCCYHILSSHLWTQMCTQTLRHRFAHRALDTVVVTELSPLGATHSLGHRWCRVLGADFGAETPWANQCWPRSSRPWTVNSRQFWFHIG